MPTRTISKTIEVQQDRCKCGNWYDRYIRQIPAELDLLENAKREREHEFASGILSGTTLVEPDKCPTCWDHEIKTRLKELRVAAI